jgi:6-phosphogluconolactonase
MLRVYAVDTETGALTGPADTAVGDLNSFGAFSPSHDRLFIVDEAGSALRSYSVDAASGALTFGNEIATSGNPVHISVDQTGGFALVAYYNQDNVEVFPIDQDGSVGTAVDTEATGDQAHAIVLSPDNAFAFVPNKGANTVSQFLFDEETGALTANSTPTASVTGGPRHLTFGADGQAAYLITELDSAIAFMTYSEAEGTLSPSIFVSNLDPDFTGTPSGAEIQVTPDGAYVYGTNRAGAESTIGMYKVLEGGALEILGYESSHGEAPRNFAIHPNGDLLIVGNHDSNNLAVFRIGSDGLLEFVEAPDIGFPAYWVGFAEFPE